MRGPSGLSERSRCSPWAPSTSAVLPPLLTIPTIGTLFVLNFVGATAIGPGLLAPVERLYDRPPGVRPASLAVGGIGLAATSFVFLLVSERTPLFGFMEPGYDPAAILASRVAEAVAVLSLIGFLAARFATARR